MDIVGPSVEALDTFSLDDHDVAYTKSGICPALGNEANLLTVSLNIEVDFKLIIPGEISSFVSGN